LLSNVSNISHQVIFVKKSLSTYHHIYFPFYRMFVLPLQTEISKRLSNIITQIIPFLSQEHQQQVAGALDRAKQVTMTELNTIMGVST